MDLVSVQCPACGANLPAREPSGGYVCDYCNSRFAAQQARSAHTIAGVQIDPQQLAQAIVAAQRGPGKPGWPAPDPVRVQQQATPDAAASAAKTGRRVALFAGLTTLLGAGIPVVVTLAQQGTFDSIPSLGQLAEKVEHLLWDHAGGPPVLVQLGGDTVFIGRTRKVLDGDQLFVDAYDAATVTRRWRIGPLGSYSDGYQYVRFAVAGDRLVLTDAKAHLHLHELATGERKSSVSLTDKVDALCAGSDGRVWVQQIDDKGHFLDVATGKLHPGERPSDCYRTQSQADGAAQARAAEQAPPVEGVQIQHVLVDGKRGVALGVKSPGTPVPRAIGFAPPSKGVEWDVVVSTVDAASVRTESLAGAAAGGRVFVVYGAGQEDWYLTALDLGSGTRVWEAKLRGVFAVDRIGGLWADPKYVLVGRTSSMEVWDAATGKQLGTVGSETYD